MDDEQQGAWLTRAETARRLGRHDSTVRLWCDQFADVLPRRVGPGEHWLYPLWAIQEIATMRSDKRSEREILDRLRQIVGGLTAPAPDFQTEVREQLAEIRRLLEELLRRSGP